MLHVIYFCLKKGLALDPENPKWARKLGQRYFQHAHFPTLYIENTTPQKPANPQKILEQYKLAYKYYKLAYKETKIKNMGFILTFLAKSAVNAGKLEEAEKYVKEMLWQAKKKSPKNYGRWTLIYEANSNLGLVALKRGKLEEACRYLLKAGNTQVKPFHPSSPPNMELAEELLKKGKKECVIKFLRSCAKFWKKRKVDGQDPIKDWIQQIKSGAIPYLDGFMWGVDKRIKKNKRIAFRAFYKKNRKAGKLFSEEVKKLEIKVNDNIGDFKAAIELLEYYSSKQLEDKDIRNKRSRIILKLLEKNSGGTLFELSEGQLDRFDDNYKEAIKLWETRVERYPKNLKILWNASCNLVLIDEELAEKYLKQGQTLEPENPRWARQLGLLYSIPERHAKPQNNLKAYKQFKLTYNEMKIKNSSYMLTYLTRTALKSGKFKDAEEYAHEMLRQAEKIGIKKWNYGNLIYDANFTLGVVSLQREKIGDACKYLLEAGKTPGSAGLSPDMALARELLKKGKKECVIEFLKLCSKFWDVKKITGKDICGIWIKQIKAGKTPKFNRFEFVNP